MIITRRNWLLRCSILANIAVVLYLCSHVMIGGGNFSMQPSSSYVIQDDPNRIQLKSKSEYSALVMFINIFDLLHTLFITT